MESILAGRDTITKQREKLLKTFTEKMEEENDRILAGIEVLVDQNRSNEVDRRLARIEEQIQKLVNTFARPLPSYPMQMPFQQQPFSSNQPFSLSPQFSSSNQFSLCGPLYSK